jgi:hypothetical protein
LEEATKKIKRKAHLEEEARTEKDVEVKMHFKPGTKEKDVVAKIAVTLTLLALFARKPIMHPKIADLNARDAKFLIIPIKIVGSIKEKTKLIFRKKMKQNNYSLA